jgi:leucyl aminopeptidase
MKISLTSSSLTSVKADWLVVPLAENVPLSPAIAELDAKLDGAISKLRERSDFTGKTLESVDLFHAPGISAERICLLGLGDAATITLNRLERAFMAAVRRVSVRASVSMALVMPETLGSADLAGAVKIAACSAEVGCVGQGLYRAEKDRHRFTEVQLVTPASADVKALESAVKVGQTLGEATNLTRDLVNLAPNDMYPEVFAARAEKVAKEVGLQCQVFDEKKLEEEKMGSLMAVAKGSIRPPRVVLLEYRGAGPGKPTIALVGKGVTFDSGGLSLKPSDSMKTMKADMAGAATVLGAMMAIARLKLPVNILGAAGLVENMLSGASYKLGDILTARNGVTIEVHNTDAEGRLVLADVLSYVVDQKVEKIIDLATLTGACVVALGEEVAGAFTNNQPWCDELLAAAGRAGEDVWQLPMFDSFNDQLRCEVADCKNVGTRWGGAITAAKFLEKFVSGTPWVHLDIAGPAFAEGQKPHKDGGATGAMVRTLVELVTPKA